MTDNVQRIGEAEKPVNTELVDMLERLLADAKAGDLLGMVAVMEITGRELGTVTSGITQPFAVLGALEFAKMRIAAQIEGALDPVTPR